MFVFPVLNEFATYSFHKLRGDVVSGITIGIILIPQGLAYGQLAGLPSIWGRIFLFFHERRRDRTNIKHVQVFGVD